MGYLPLKARLYIYLISASGLGVALYFALGAFHEPQWWLAIIGVTATVAILDFIPIKPYGSDVEVTISNAGKFAAVLMFPPAVAILGTFLGTAIGELASKRRWFKRLFNISIMTITFAVVVASYSRLSDPHEDLLGSPQNVSVLVLAGLTNFGVNSILVATVISFAGSIPFRYVWLQNYTKVILHDLTIIPLAVSVAIMWRFNPFAIFLVIPPLLVVRHSYQTANHLQRQTEEALRALMHVIDERDNETSNHSERVAQLARKVAKALDLAPSEIEIIAPAASLHDLGKVGMEGAILFKAGILTDEERKRAQRHAPIGGELLSKFPLFEKGAVLVRHHHERYDGAGYPDGLKGEEIPLGARIIAVADSYTAMIEDRPYRRGMTRDQAIEELFRCAGTQFDPNVVRALIKVLEEMAVEEKPPNFVRPALTTSAGAAAK